MLGRVGRLERHLSKVAFHRRTLILQSGRNTSGNRLDLPRQQAVAPQCRFFARSGTLDDEFQNDEGYDPNLFDLDYIDDEDEDKKAREMQERQDAETREGLLQKKGRLWSDPWDMTEMMESKVTFEELPNWSPSYVSRISQERVQLLPQKIPTVLELAQLPLPPPPPPEAREGQFKAYALHRKRAIYKYMLEKVSEMAESRVEPIKALGTWEEKQDAVDELFEHLEFELKEKEEILGKHPLFGSWVEKALEEYLRKGQSESLPESVDVDESAVPMFMDCYGPKDSPEAVVPEILTPLRSLPNGNNGKMVEEWQLSAHKESRRIMLRQSMRKIARVLHDNAPSRIFVNGQRGAGKSSTLAAMVACIRKSGGIVLYLPDGDQLHKNGFYIEPNGRREGIFDLPILSQRVCKDFLESHKDDLSRLRVDAVVFEEFFTTDQLEQFDSGRINEMSVADLLEYGADKTSAAPMCYAAGVSILMNQESTPFYMVLDEFNCYFEPGHYFHMDYDVDVVRPIPYNQINLFKPALDAMAITMDREDFDENKFVFRAANCMKRGAIIVATTESHAVARLVTDALVSNVKWQVAHPLSSIPIHLVEIPRLSALEVEHMLANYEATGLGKLRLDRGETVMDDKEVAFLRMVSGGVAQRLMDACIM